LPNLTVIAPADALSAYQATIAAAAHDGPVYLRLGVEASDPVYSQAEPFVIGKGRVLRDGRDLTLVAAGVTIVPNTLAAAELLAQQGISARVIDLPTIKPIDADLLETAALETGRIVTVEEHSTIGGLGSAVAEVVAERAPALVHAIGLPDAFCKTIGSYAELLQRYALDSAGIADSVRRILG
jgi:transketolase